MLQLAKLYGPASQTTIRGLKTPRMLEVSIDEAFMALEPGFAQGIASHQAKQQLHYNVAWIRPLDPETLIPRIRPQIFIPTMNIRTKLF